MSTSLHARRQLKNVAAQILATVATIFGLFWLVWIMWTTLSKGLGSLNLALFTEMTPPPGDEGGMLNAFAGSALMSLLGIAMGAPIGVLAGTFLAEYSKRSLLAEAVRFVNDILLSAPSIVLGLFVYTVVVAQMGHFSALAGGIALAFIVLPVVVRTTDEMLRLVPAQMREAALSLGVPQWKVILQVLYRASLPGIVTGILLALARITGETAPLLFTALNNQYWTTNIFQPMANVPVVIFQYAMSPYDTWHTLAWAGAFVLTLFVLLISLVARAIVLRNKMVHD